MAFKNPATIPAPIRRRIAYGGKGIKKESEGFILALLKKKSRIYAWN
jgi:hypothetical protein